MNIIKLNQEHVEDVLKLQNIINDILPKQEIYFSSSKEELMTFLHEDNGICCGVYNNDNDLIAFSCMRFPNEDNLGYDIDLPIEFLDRVCHKEITLVHQEHRGKGYQRLLFKFLEKEVKLTPYTIIMATVSPINPYSAKNLLKCGMKIIKIKEKYNGIKRYILIKNLEKLAYQVEIDNYEKQKELFDAGFCCMEIKKNIMILEKKWSIN